MKRAWLLAAGLAALAACGRSKEEKGARQALQGTYLLDVDRTAGALPASQREFYLKANKGEPPQYVISPDGTWTMRVKLPNGEVVREGTWTWKAGRFQFTPTKVDGNLVPGRPFEVKLEGGEAVWDEDGPSYLRKKA